MSQATKKVSVMNKVAALRQCCGENAERARMIQP
jgi:hypothetical protein